MKPLGPRQEQSDKNTCIGVVYTHITSMSRDLVTKVLKEGGTDNGRERKIKG